MPRGGKKAKPFASPKSGRQLSLVSFFTPSSPTTAATAAANQEETADKTKSSPEDKNAPQPEYPLYTVVKKKYSRTDNDDEDDNKDDHQDEYYYYVNGKVIEHIRTRKLIRDKSGGSSNEEEHSFLYRVQLDTLPSSNNNVGDHHGRCHGRCHGRTRPSTNTKICEEWTPEQVAWGVTLYRNINTKVAKYFYNTDNNNNNDETEQEELFVGRVTRVEQDEQEALYFHIVYEDGDEEDLEQQELDEAKELYAQLCSIRALHPPTKTSKRKQKQKHKSKTRNGRRKKKRASSSSYSSEEEDEQGESDDDDDRTVEATPDESPKSACIVTTNTFEDDELSVTDGVQGATTTAVTPVSTFVQNLGQIHAACLKKEQELDDERTPRGYANAPRRVVTPNFVRSTIVVKKEEDTTTTAVKTETDSNGEGGIRHRINFSQGDEDSTCNHGMTVPTLDRG